MVILGGMIKAVGLFTFLSIYQYFYSGGFANEVVSQYFIGGHFNHSTVKIVVR